MGVRIPASFEDATGTIARLTGEIEFLVAATPGEVLTANNPASTASFAAGGGGSGGVQVVTVPVSSAQILDLANTPVVLVAGTPGNVTVVISSVLVYLAGLVPYLDGGGRIIVGTPTAAITWCQVQGAGYWDSASDIAANPSTSNGGQLSPAGWAGADVALSEDTASPTLGDGTLLVTVSYFLAPTA